MSLTVCEFDQLYPDAGFYYPHGDGAYRVWKTKTVLRCHMCSDDTAWCLYYGPDAWTFSGVSSPLICSEVCIDKLIEEYTPQGFEDGLAEDEGSGEFAPIIPIDRNLGK